MRTPKHFQSILVGATVAIFAGTRIAPSHDRNGPVLTATAAFVAGSTGATSGMRRAGSTDAPPAADPSPAISLATKSALSALSGLVTKLSSPTALDDAFRSYFAYKAAHPADVKKPYLYFVDYGLPSTTARGYVFDMDALTIVDGPFTVAHGRGSSTTQYGVPTKFSNASGSNSTSLGLYVTRALYDFHGHVGGQAYSSIGLQLDGVSTGFNDNALARRVVAHGAPYVTPTKAGRSEGCPAMEPSRAQRLLPQLANGAMVFLFAPNEHWLAGDPWLASSNGTLAG